MATLDDEDVRLKDDAGVRLKAPPRTLVPCPSCGRKLRARAQFCARCGHKLVDRAPGGRFERAAPTARGGDVIAGFRIERLLGRGGMGMVFLATELKFSRPVALKLIAPELASEPEFRRRFRREADLAPRLTGPHIVPVYRAGEANGELYIAMAYIDGRDLGATISSTGPLHPRRAAAVIAQVADALDHAHSQGLVHRDVKPANILLAGGGTADSAYLTDFGLLKPFGERSSTAGRWVGSLDYAAPEQIEGRAVDGRADTYSLGCVLHKTLTGSVPFPRDSPSAAMWAHMHEPPPDPRAIRPEIPRALGNVIARALAKDPSRRFQSAGELGRAALAAVDGRVPTAPSPSEATAEARSWIGAATAAATYLEGAPPLEPPHDIYEGLEQPSRRRAIAWMIALPALAALAVVAALAFVLLHHPSSPSRRAARQALGLAGQTSGASDHIDQLVRDLGHTSDPARRRAIASQLDAAGRRAHGIATQAHAAAGTPGLDPRIVAADTAIWRLSQDLVRVELCARTSTCHPSRLTPQLSTDSHHLRDMIPRLVRLTKQGQTATPMPSPQRPLPPRARAAGASSRAINWRQGACADCGGLTVPAQALTYDSSTRQVVVLAADPSNPAHSDATWLWDGGSWTSGPSDQAPTIAQADQMAYDERNDAVVATGVGRSGAMETWTFDGSTWTQRQPAHSPPAVAQAAVAYDPRSQQVILFGGAAADGSSSDQTWAWNGDDWHRLTGTGPKPRRGAMLALDPASGSLVLAGGTAPDSKSGAQTWRWTGDAWQWAGSGGPAGAGAYSLLSDSAHRQLLLVGTDSHGDWAQWRWIGSAWTAVASSGATPTAALAAFDDAAGSVLAVGQSPMRSWNGDVRVEGAAR